MLKLADALYIHGSNVHLISIMAVNEGNDYTTHFDSSSCWVTNKSNTVRICGTLSPSKHLYVLSTKIPSLQSKTTNTSSMAYYTQVPNIETWHYQLGHCNTQAIINMARKGMMQDMLIDLSLLPVNCNHCALGKQCCTA